MEDDQHISATPSKQRFISKRSLKNKSVTIGFDEDDLRNYVTGFHKRKKKRRKEAVKQQEEAKRRKRIELRKKRKEEREYVTFGGAPPATGSTAEVTGEDDDEDEDEDEDEDKEQVLSVLGTTTYDNGDLKVTVTTSEISREDEIIIPIKNTEKVQDGEERSEPVSGGRKNRVAIAKKKPIKRVVQRKSRTKSHSRKDNKKGKRKGKGR